MDSVAIIITHYKGKKELLYPLFKSMRGKLPENCEIIIFDNGHDLSHGDTSSQVDDLISLTNIVNRRVVITGHGNGNVGFAKGNNLAVGMTNAEYVLFLNNDTIIHDKDWIGKLIRSHKEKSIVGAQYIDHNTMTDVFGYGIIPYIAGWCLLMKRKDFIDLGKFDERVGLAYFEDVILCDTAVRSGYELIQVECGVEHLGNSTAKKMGMDKLTMRAMRYFRSYMILTRKPERGNRIVFLCDYNREFNDNSLYGDGVGGAEASLIHLTRQLAKNGYDVWVYCDTPTVGQFSGVNYEHIDTFHKSDYADVLVVFRNMYRFGLDGMFAKKKIFWSTDQWASGDFMTQIFPHVDEIILISEFHKKHFSKNYPTDKPIHVIDLGIDWEEYREIGEKQRGLLIFCSVPHRGLSLAEPIFQKIREKIPHAELVVTSDYTLWGGPADNHDYYYFKDRPGIHFLGNINREELIKWQKLAEVMLYPCIYDELFCVSALECQASGAIPVTTNYGALPTTVGKRGFVFGGDIEQKMADQIVEILSSPVEYDDFRKQTRIQIKKDYTWESIVKQWEEVIM